MKVRVYRNLRKECFSVMEKGRVIDHVSNVILANAKLIVSEAGRQRVLRDKRKNVHAFVEGGRLPDAGAYSLLTFRSWKACPVRYNPYTGPSFMTEDGPIASAPYVVLSHGRLITALFPSETHD